MAEDAEQKPDNRVTSYVTHDAYDAIRALEVRLKWSQSQVVRELLDEALAARAAKAQT
jgi:hypothetical protein